MTEQDDINTNAIELNVLDCTMTDLYGYLLGIFSKLEVFDTFKISTCQFLDFLIDVQRTYQNTPYHSFYHATDVVIVLYYIMLDLKAKKYFSDKEIATLFIAAICHDAGHVSCLKHKFETDCLNRTMIHRPVTTTIIMSS